MGVAIPPQSTNSPRVGDASAENSFNTAESFDLGAKTNLYL